MLTSFLVENWGPLPECPRICSAPSSASLLQDKAVDSINGRFRGSTTSHPRHRHRVTYPTRRSQPSRSRWAGADRPQFLLPCENQIQQAQTRHLGLWQRSIMWPRTAGLDRLCNTLETGHCPKNDDTRKIVQSTFIATLPGVYFGSEVFRQRTYQKFPPLHLSGLFTGSYPGMVTWEGDKVLSRQQLN